MCSCSRVSESGNFRDNCEAQGGIWVKDPHFTIQVPIIKDGTVVTTKRVSAQEYCELP